MSSRREVLIRILALLQRKTLIETKKSHIRKLKMALFDCAINEKKSCSVDGGQGIYPLCFVPTPEDLTAQESPPPGICHPRQKKCCCPGISRGGGKGWAQVELAPYETTRAAATAASKGNEFLYISLPPQHDYDVK